MESQLLSTVYAIVQLFVCQLYRRVEKSWSVNQISLWRRPSHFDVRRRLTHAPTVRAALLRMKIGWFTQLHWFVHTHEWAPYACAERMATNENNEKSSSRKCSEQSQVQTTRVDCGHLRKCEWKKCISAYIDVATVWWLKKIFFAAFPSSRSSKTNDGKSRTFVILAMQSSTKASLS